jgi:hypothetical protein
MVVVDLTSLRKCIAVISLQPDYEYEEMHRMIVYRKCWDFLFVCLLSRHIASISS